MLCNYNLLSKVYFKTKILYFSDYLIIAKSYILIPHFLDYVFDLFQDVHSWYLLWYTNYFYQFYNESLYYWPKVKVGEYKTSCPTTSIQCSFSLIQIMLSCFKIERKDHKLCNKKKKKLESCPMRPRRRVYTGILHDYI